MRSSLECIMSPRSIAVVGATNRPGSVGLHVFRNILNAGYQGVLYPVHPKLRSVQGVRAYPRLTDIPDPDLDLAVLIVQPESAVEVAREAAGLGVKGVIVITAGFKEIGGRGAELEAELKSVLAAGGIRMIGPNCLGIMNTNPAVQMNASFATKMPKRGNIAFVSQSGALCTAVLDFAAGKNVGFSKFISVGNKADVDEADLLRYLKDDPDTSVILMYLEDIANGPEFSKVAREVTWDARKPILAIKSGRSAEGAKAAASHTGSLAGSDMAYDAIFFQSGIQRMEGVDELFDSAIALSSQPAPKGKQIAIITNAGGPGIMATDAAIRHGLSLAPLNQHTRDKLRQVLPNTASVNNPVDVIGDATHERYEAAIREVLNDPSVNGAIVILTPQAMTDVLETAEIVPRVAKDVDKPILCAFMGIVDVSAGVSHLQKHGIPVYNFPEEAVRAMAAMVKFGTLLSLPSRLVRRVAADRDTAAQIISKALAGRDNYVMGEHEANQILQRYGFPTLPSRLVGNKFELAEAVEELGYPLAMKIISPQIIHKVDAGGVVLRIKSREEAEKAFDQIMAGAKKFNPQAEIKGILVEKMARRGVEVILGATRDPKFGPICMFGLGGTFVEVLKDVTFRLAPMWEVSADIMIQSIKAYKVLQGTRGMPPSDVAAIKDCLLRLSQLVSDHPEISELDINPLIVFPEGDGCVVADSRILLARPNQ